MIGKHLRVLCAAAASLGLAFAAADIASAQAPQARAAPRADAAAAPAGAYTIDARHAAVVARVPHMGFSYSVFRFGDANGTLTWDPANPAANRLSATVGMASIETPVVGFADELKGDRFLKATQFPQATFTSTAFRRVDASHAQVDGALVLMGVTKAVTFDVELVGAGQGMHGTVMGVIARTRLNARDYPLPAFIGTPIDLQIDAEFDRAAN